MHLALIEQVLIHPSLSIFRLNYFNKKSLSVRI